MITVTHGNTRLSDENNIKHYSLAVALEVCVNTTRSLAFVKCVYTLPIQFSHRVYTRA